MTDRELHDLKRWKSMQAPRIEALQGLLEHAQREAWAGREAIASLASERAANAILTTELERLRSAEVIGWMWAGCFVPAAEAGPIHRAEGRPVCYADAERAAAELGKGK